LDLTSRSEALVDNSKVTWLIPWHANVPRPEANDGSAKELHREMTKSHPLFGITVRDVAYRQDCDDVLFELLDGSGRFALVHLTFAKQPEVDPRWPRTEIFKDFEHFEHQRMRPDHVKFVFPDPPQFDAT
jgi:hypothetical protein